MWKAVTLFADATWHFTPQIDLGAFFGLAAGGQLRSEDSAGRKIAESDNNTVAILGLNASVKF